MNKNTIGYILMVASFPVWSMGIVIPFLPVSASSKAIGAGSFIALGEIFFWVGGLLAGPAMIAKFRKPKVRTGKSYRNKTVAVFGATGGIGTAVCEALIREGAIVFGFGRNTKSLSELKKNLPDIQTVQLDSFSDEAIQSSLPENLFFDHAIITIGKDERKSLFDHSFFEIQGLMHTNMLATIQISKMITKSIKSGTIGVIGGFGDGRLALPFYSVDVATRAGISAFVLSMNREFKLLGKKITMQYISPAPTDTIAESKYSSLWKEMGSPVQTVDKTADFILAAVLSGNAISIMGWQNALISKINNFSNLLADCIALDKVGKLLKNAFGKNPMHFHLEKK